MNMKKLLAFALCLVLVSGLSIAGTIAWLTDETKTITNTFSKSGIDITLVETPNSGDEWKAQMIPGKEYAKDPVVSVVDTTDIDVYLFVKFEEIAPDIATTDKVETTKDYLTYTSTLTAANGWTLVDGTTNVWYRTVPANAEEADRTWNLLEGNKVTINSGLTADETNIAPNSLQLKYTAYAIQVAGFEGNAAGAWAEFNE